MTSDKIQVSLRDRIKLTIRGFQVFGKANPYLHLSIVILAVLQGVSPYVTIFLSARLISALSAKEASGVIWTHLIWLIAGTLFMSVLTALAEHFKEYRQGNVYWTNRGINGRKLLSLDFPALNNQRTQELRMKVENNSNKFRRGLFMLREQLEKGLRGMTGVVSSIVLTVSFFRFKVSEDMPNLLFLNSFWMIPGLILLVGLVVFLSTKLAHEYEEYQLNHQQALYGALLKEQMWYERTVMIEHSIALENRIYAVWHYLDSLFSEYFNGRMKDPSALHKQGKGGVLFALSSAVSALFMGITYVLVCLKAYGGAFDIGYVAQYVGAITALNGGLSLIAGALASLYTNAVYLKDTFEFLNISNEMYQGSLTTEKRSDHHYDIEFRDVSFRYPGSDTWALRHVQVKFEVGKRLALVGKNGSGKTTFIKLLCRLYDPDEGEILLNGINIKKYNYDDYQRLFSVVFQDYHLLDVPVAENVAVSRQVDEEKVLDVLDKAGFTDRLKELPKGIHTYLGKTFDPEGTELSGGESQKVAIARALYPDAAFLILDEPTAALDPIAEAEIYQHLDRIVQNKTAIYISHRLSTCRFCDEILVFDHGQIVQKGTHEALLGESEDLYAKLWNAQAQYYQKKQTVV